MTTYVRSGYVSKTIMVTVRTPTFLERVLSIVTTNRNYRNAKHIKETLNIKDYLGTLCINKSYCK